MKKKLVCVRVLIISVCVCLGSGPATAFLKQSGVHMDSKGFIPVNKVQSFCNTACHCMYCTSLTAL